MSIFHFNLHDSWQVAFRYGHFAMKLLADCQRIERDYINNRNIKASLDKMDPTYLHHVNVQENLSERFFQYASNSVFLYQSMMEALINWAIELTDVDCKKRPSFKKKWIDLLNNGEQPCDNFNNYHKEIYRDIRNIMLHPKENELSELNNVCCKKLYLGYKSGWKAYEQLCYIIKRPHDDNSWKIFCGANGVAIMDS